MSIRLRDLETHAWIPLQGSRPGIPNHRQRIEARARRAARLCESSEVAPAVHVVDAPGASGWEIAWSIVAWVLVLYGLGRLVGL